MEFIEKEHRKPSKYYPEEKLMFHFIHHNKKLYNNEILRKIGWIVYISSRDREPCFAFTLHEHFSKHPLLIFSVVEFHILKIVFVITITVVTIAKRLIIFKQPNKNCNIFVFLMVAKKIQLIIQNGTKSNFFLLFLWRKSCFSLNFFII